MLSVKSNIDEAIMALTTLQKKQVPYAISTAINDTAKDVKVGVERQLKKDIDKPTPFTQRAFKIARSSKKQDTIQASVYINKIQDEYLKYQIFGGKRKARKGAPVIIPRQAQRNKYGNLVRGKLSRLSKQGKTYLANRVINQRMKKNSKPIAYIADSATYTPRFKFFERAKQVTKKTFSRHFDKRLKLAISTSK